MIDIENMVFTAVYNAVIAVYSNAYITSTYESIPQKFPCVHIAEIDNYAYTRSQDEQLKEHNANVTYEVNIYSNLANKNKEEAKKIMSIVDETMQNLKFTRQMMSPTPNFDRTKYRITARYRAVVAEPKTINGKKVYQMYRK